MPALKTLEEFLATIDHEDHRARMVEVLQWVESHYPTLQMRIAWSQPMFTMDGTFIVGFSAAKKHMAIAPERAGILHFEDEFEARGVDHGKMFVRQPWAKPFDFDLLGRLIEFNMQDKQGCTTFWRKSK
ncbi:iron chaperone [Gleimia hominis]|uniref:iron chaperone n=1 Tax=Gleimia hominis TaxID=595468 RepID=UPI000C8056EC|nr:DUF1801 domain-containing protein [Gleimia hominis]WIK64727.1 DUF1801 domain-containing protein [Gleimia hominis]